MVVNINEPITKDAFEKIILSFNNLKEGERLDIYLCSVGGDVSAMEAIVDFLDTNVDRVRLIGYGELFSAAFEIFFKSKCDRTLLSGTMGMAHFTGVNVNFLDEKRPNKVDDKAYLQWSKIEKAGYVKFCESLGFNAKELERIRKGEDVWFQYDRLASFLLKDIEQEEISGSSSKHSTE
jgi:hypothetical protein